MQNLTLVTACYKPRREQFKGQADNQYMELMRAFANVRNPVMLYTDDFEIGRAFMDIRKLSGLAAYTVVVILSSESLWSYKLLPEIEQFYKSAHDTSHPVESKTRAEEASTMLSKVNFIEHAVNENYFGRKYFCWVDFSYLYFSGVSNEKKSFSLHVPRDLSKNSVGISKSTSEPSSLAISGDFKHFNSIKAKLYVASSRTFYAFCQYFKSVSVNLFQANMNGTDKVYKRSSGFDLQFFTNDVINSMVKLSHS